MGLIFWIFGKEARKIRSLKKEVRALERRVSILKVYYYAVKESQVRGYSLGYSYEKQLAALRSEIDATLSQLLSMRQELSSLELKTGS